MNESKYVKKINSDELLSHTSGRKYLSHIDIELTERCDNNCVHCSINIPENSQKQYRELNTTEWKKIIKEAADMGVLSVRFTGGEPLLREDFSELYLYTRKLGIRIFLFTNARNITVETAKMLSKIPPLEKMEVTVYGMRKESYEKVSRVPGSYEEFRRGIDLLLKYNIKFVVKGILLPDNLQEKDEFESWAAALPWMDSLPSYSYDFELRERRDSESKNKAISSLRNLPEEFAGKPVVKKKPDRSKIEFLKRYIGPPGEKLFSCGAGDSLSIDAYGFVHPCLTLKAEEFSYDSGKGSLKEAFYKYFPEKLKIKATNPEYLNRCAKCFLKGLCLQCPSRSWSETGTFDTPVEYLCKVAHNEAYGLGLLKDGEKAWEVKDWKRRIDKIEEKSDGKNR